MKKLYILLFVLPMLWVSCSNDAEDNIPEDTKNYDLINEQEILEYLDEKNLTAQKNESGLYYIIHNEGAGISPLNNSTVKVNYKGYFLSDSVFDENDDISFNLTGVIEGFSQGLQLLKEGGNISLFIPSKLAYKEFGNGIIPPNTVVNFDIELIQVN